MVNLFKFLRSESVVGKGVGGRSILYTAKISVNNFSSLMKDA
jgi:hypothetical protein